MMDMDTMDSIDPHLQTNSTSKICLTVKYGNENYDVNLEGNELKVEDLMYELEKLTTVSKENMKLISQGKILNSGMRLQELTTTKIMMMGSKNHELTNNLPIELPRIKDDLTDEGRNYRRKYAVDAQSLTQRERLNTNYKFHEIQTLPNLPNQQKAYEILHSLANDPAILYVLEKHKWSVGILCELYPEGYVGVSDVCVMGLNQNHGQKIHLRLRTDDLTGFRKILSIRKVLFHELAHNVHSDHDDNFYILMREIEREVNEHDWTKKKGRQLGKGRGYEWGDEVRYPQEEGQTQPPPQKVYKLMNEEGSSISSLKSPGELVREKILEREREREREREWGSQKERSSDEREVREVRAEEEEQEQESEESEESEESDEEIICCGGHQPTNANTTTTQTNENISNEVNPSPPSSIEGMPDMVDTHQSNLAAPAPIVAISPPPPPPPPSVAAAAPAAVLEESNGPLLEIVQGAVDGMLLNYLFSTNLTDDFVDETRSLFSLLPEPIQQLRMALYALSARLSSTHLTAVLGMIKEILKRIQSSSDPKYRTIKWSNKLFQRVIVANDAIALLLSTGFEIKEMSSADKAVSFVREDSALLYMTLSILDTVITTLEPPPSSSSS